MRFSFPVFLIPACFSNYLASEGKDVVREDSLDSVFIFSADSLSRQSVVTHHEQEHTDELRDGA